MSDFQQTVNLKKKVHRSPRGGVSSPKRPVLSKTETSVASGFGRSAKATEIDRVYKIGREGVKNGGDLQKINHPDAGRVNERIFKQIVFVLVVLLAGAVVYGLFFHNRGVEQRVDTERPVKWYAVKLLNGETYYGQIKDIAANPLVITNVYYNYDQLNGNGKEKGPIGNLRLVKRGKETYGPSGTMYIYQDRVKLIDLLRDDSKVLKAILDYEK